MQTFLGHLRRNLSSQILLALLLGTLTGLFFGEYASVFSFMGDIFLRLFQMPVLGKNSQCGATTMVNFESSVEP